MVLSPREELFSRPSPYKKSIKAFHFARVNNYLHPDEIQGDNLIKGCKSIDEFCEGFGFLQSAKIIYMIEKNKYLTDQVTGKMVLYLNTLIQRNKKFAKELVESKRGLDKSINIFEKIAFICKYVSEFGLAYECIYGASLCFLHSNKNIIDQALRQYETAIPGFLLSEKGKTLEILISRYNSTYNYVNILNQ